MADFASIIAQSALQSTSPQNAPDLAGSFAKGAQLAQARQQMDLQRAQLEKEKATVATAKLDKFVEAVQAGKDQKGSARSNYYGKILPKYRDALGLTDTFSDESLQFITATPENLARLNTVIAEVRAGRITEAQGIALANDPTQFAGIAPEITEDVYGDLAEAAKTRINAQAQENALNATNQRQLIDIGSAGQQAIARESGQEFVKFQGAGGSAGMNKAEAAITKAIEDLESGKVVTGGAAENLPYGGTTQVLSRTNKPLKALMDNVLSTQNIKALSGDPNPTQAQIDAINSRILDPAAPSATNVAKLKAELERLRSERTQKVDLFRQQGFLRDGGQSSGAPASGGRSSAPSQPRSGVRDIKELSNPTVSARINSYVGDSIERLSEIANAYGVDPMTLRQRLGGL